MSEIVRAFARKLGELEQEMAQEWLRLIVNGVNSYEATKRIEAEYATKHRLALADYEVALASLKGRGNASEPRG